MTTEKLYEYVTTNRKITWSKECAIYQTAAQNVLQKVMNETK